MKELMEHKFAEDSRKFRMTMDIDLAEQKTRIFSQLQKIAAAMHGMDCNSLPEKDYQRFIPSLEARELLRYSSIWKCQEEGWQFPTIILANIWRQSILPSVCLMR